MRSFTKTNNTITFTYKSDAREYSFDLVVKEDGAFPYIKAVVYDDAFSFTSDFADVFKALSGIVISMDEVTNVLGTCGIKQG